MDGEELEDATPEERNGSASGQSPEEPEDSGRSAGHAAAVESGDGSALDDLPAAGVAIEAAGEPEKTPALEYPIVGVGASAGGLQAFREILENLDPATGMAFVLVTHLAPDQRSFLSEIVERYTLMPVVPIEDGQRPEPNHLYVLQPNQSVTLRNGRFVVEARQVAERAPKTIDKFFYSLAADQRNRAVGVVLSGADGDGALGLKAIKGEGGIALVQSPDTAVYTGMPLSSIVGDHVDLVIPPREIALELSRLGNHFTRPVVRALEEGAVPPDEEQAFGRILQMLRSFSGIDFRQYKPATIRRRIARRMLLQRMDQIGQYLRLLQTRSDELRILQEDALISVTRFFRDTAFWESVRDNVLPGLIQNRPPERPIRVWSAGCSTGEEAFSLAILIFEYLFQHGLEIPVQIFGTDASDQSIETARLATYPETIISDVSPERLRRYFTKVERGFQVCKRVRDACIFARQNLCSDPPFSHIDILSCRNVMIYFNPGLQRQVVLTFHYALDPGGYLLLGMSEGLRDYGDIFNPVDRKHKIYTKTGMNLPIRFEAPRGVSILHQFGAGLRQRQGEPESPVWPELELQRAADRIVLARFGPPGLVIDEHLTVLQSRGQTSQFLEIAQGSVTWELSRVLRPSLVNDVSAAAHRAIQENAPFTTTTLFTDGPDGEQQLQIDVLPVASAASRRRCFLILFQALPGRHENASPEMAANPQLTADEKDRIISQLRRDLGASRLHLQTVVEERDMRNQELVSANEEIQSANEELQSGNEELETTKEELQSANEELQTVNDELQQRNNVLTQTGNDLANLLNSVNIPLLMLTNDLQIRQFTPPMQRLLNVRPADIGRSISEIRLQLSIENIEPLLREVLETLGTRELEVQDREDRWHLLRIRPYRTSENKIEGLVVVLVDIDQLRRSQQLLVDARDFAQSVLQSVPVPIVVVNQDRTVGSVNTAFCDLAEMRARDLEGHLFPELANLLWGIDGLSSKLDSILQSPAGSRLEFEHRSTTAHRKILLFKAQALSTEGSPVMLVAIEDITARREAENLIASQNQALENEVQNAARHLQRTQGELRELTAHLFTGQEEERQHIARELHDDVSQRLSLIGITLQEITGIGLRREDLERLRRLREQVDVLNNDVRSLSHRLHPSILVDLGLPAALKVLVQEFGERENMPATFFTHDLPGSVPPIAALSLYRIAQEALRNVSKHAGKTHVKVVLSGAGGHLQLKVTDFGLGFDQESEMALRGLGMISMQERASLAGGTLAVRSALGEGTTVTVEIPLEHHA